MSNLCKLYLFFLFALPKAFSAPRQPRLSLAENFMPQYFVRNINGNPDTYSFGYDISDTSTGNIQFRNEERYPNGTVIGSYGYVDPSGRSLTYKYVADHNGYRITQDSPNKHYANYEAHNPIRQPLPDSEESTITWTRPRKPVKKNDDNLGRNTSHDNIAILGDVVSGPR